jgi:predicted metal-dependent phosphoesterase TrpH
MMTVEIKSGKRWLKAELHSHCNLDPIDYQICGYSPEQLISRAADLGYDVLAFTCHNTDIFTEALFDYAKDFGITLIPGMEVTVEQTRHILVYNFNTEPDSLNTLDKIRRHSRPDTLVIAPHPFFPGKACLRALLKQNLDIFDALEYSGFHIDGLNFNRRVVRLAEETGKTVVGCGDIHQFYQLDRTFTWIYAEPELHSILNAIKQGLVRMQTAPLSWLEAAKWWATALFRSPSTMPFPTPERSLDKLSPARE